MPAHRECQRFATLRSYHPLPDCENTLGSDLPAAVRSFSLVQLLFASAQQLQKMATWAHLAAARRVIERSTRPRTLGAPTIKNRSLPGLVSFYALLLPYGVR